MRYGLIIQMFPFEQGILCVVKKKNVLVVLCCQQFADVPH